MASVDSECPIRPNGILRGLCWTAIAQLRFCAQTATASVVIAGPGVAAAGGLC